MGGPPSRSGKQARITPHPPGGNAGPLRYSIGASHQRHIGGTSAAVRPWPSAGLAHNRRPMEHSVLSAFILLLLALDPLGSLPVFIPVMRTLAPERRT